MAIRERITLVDDVSNPARNAESSLDSLSESTDKVSESSEKASKSGSGMSDMLSSVFNPATLAAAAGAAALAAGMKGLSIAIDQTDRSVRRQATLKSLGLDADRAKRANSDLMDVVSNLGVEYDKAAEQQSKLYRAGFSDDTVKDLLSYFADLDLAVEGSADSLADILAEVNNLGEANLSNIEQISSQTGIKSEELINNIARIIGRTSAETRVLLEQTRISSEAFKAGVVDTLYQTGEAGEQSAKMVRETWSGTFTRLREEAVQLLDFSEIIDDNGMLPWLNELTDSIHTLKPEVDGIVESLGTMFQTLLDIDDASPTQLIADIGVLLSDAQMGITLFTSWADAVSKYTINLLSLYRTLSLFAPTAGGVVNAAQMEARLKLAEQGVFGQQGSGGGSGNVWIDPKTGKRHVIQETSTPFRPAGGGILPERDGKSGSSGSKQETLLDRLMKAELSGTDPIVALFESISDAEMALSDFEFEMYELIPMFDKTLEEQLDIIKTVDNVGDTVQKQFESLTSAQQDYFKALLESGVAFEDIAEGIKASATVAKKTADEAQKQGQDELTRVLNLLNSDPVKQYLRKNPFAELEIRQRNQTDITAEQVLANSYYDQMGNLVYRGGPGTPTTNFISGINSTQSQPQSQQQNAPSPVQLQERATVININIDGTNKPFVNPILVQAAENLRSAVEQAFRSAQ